MIAISLGAIGGGFATAASILGGLYIKMKRKREGENKNEKENQEGEHKVEIGTVHSDHDMMMTDSNLEHHEV